MAIGTGLGLIIGGLLAAGSTAVSVRQQGKAESAAADRARRAEELRMKMASKVTAPRVKEEAQIELESEEAAEDAAILKRSKRNRLKVAKAGAVGGLQGSGTGLKVG